MSLAPRNAERKFCGSTWKAKYTQFISSAAKAALCIAGDAVCLMGAPKTPTIVVEPSMCMKIKPRQVVVNAPHCIRVAIIEQQRGC